MESKVTENEENSIKFDGRKYDRMGLVYNLNQNQRYNCHIMDTRGKGTNGN